VAKGNDEPAAEVENSDTSGSEGSLVNEVEQVNQHSMQLHFSSRNISVERSNFPYLPQVDIE
jgi:hypothetical protein